METHVYSTPSDVSAEEGVVLVDGPDGVAVSFTPEAAETTADRLLDGSAEAKGQQVVEAIRKGQERRSGA